MWCVGVVSVLARPSGSCPTLFQRGGHQAVVGSHATALALRQGRVGAKPLHGVRVRLINWLQGLLVGCHRSCRDIAVAGREELETGLDHAGIDGIGWEILTDRGAILLSEMVAPVACAVLRLDEHCVCTLPAVDTAVHERGAGPWAPAGVGALRLGVVILAQRLDLRTRLPGHRGGVRIGDAAFPRCEGQAWW